MTQNLLLEAKKNKRMNFRKIFRLCGYGFLNLRLFL